MERLTALDASFLRIETETAHMHVGWLSTVRLPPGERELDVALLRASISSRLQHAPRFRRRVILPGLGDPLLVDDAEFSIERHVRVRSSGAAPMPETRLREVCDRFLSTQLDRSHPLWEILIIPRVAGGRAAVLGKIHHAMVDGIAAVELGMLLFDLAPTPAPVEPDDWRPEPEPGPVRAIVESAMGTAVDQFREIGRAARLGLEPRRATRIAASMRRAAFSLAESLAEGAPQSFLNRPITAERTLSTGRVPMSRLARLREASGLKLNDLVLALSTVALRRAQLAAGERPLPLRAMVPISVRDDRDGAAAGNRIVLGFIELPLDEADPRAALERIHEQTAALKAAGQAEGADLLLRAVGRVPGPIAGRVAELAAAPRTYNLTISNVPGPKVPVYAAGAEVESILPVIPLSDGHALAIGVLSYAGALHIALHADPVTLPGTDAIAASIADALTELEVAFGVAPAVPEVVAAPVAAGTRG